MAVGVPARVTIEAKLYYQKEPEKQGKERAWALITNRAYRVLITTEPLKVGEAIKKILHASGINRCESDVPKRFSNTIGNHYDWTLSGHATTTGPLIQARWVGRESFGHIWSLLGNKLQKDGFWQVHIYHTPRPQRSPTSGAIRTLRYSYPSPLAPSNELSFTSSDDDSLELPDLEDLLRRRASIEAPVEGNQAQPVVIEDDSIRASIEPAIEPQNTTTEEAQHTTVEGTEGVVEGPPGPTVGEPPVPTTTVDEERPGCSTRASTARLRSRQAKRSTSRVKKNARGKK